MQKLLFRIDGNDSVAKDIFSLRLSADIPVVVHSGQFVDIALDGFYLRRPISVCDCGPEGLTLVYKTVGEGTRQLSKMKVGAGLDLLIGLGHGFSTDGCKSAALLAGGGLGAAPLHLLCKELLAQGKAVTVALGFNSESDIVLVEEYRKLGVTPLLATMDGSVGTRGFVTDAIAAAKPQYDFFYTCGPMKMMQAVCSQLNGAGEASLEERMGCGAGYCYGCSCHTTVGAKRICKDGPVFRKEEIIW